ncbi:Small GTPase superfamily, ARF/SAR type, partial [Cynara cardunculus var. scolymus]
AVRCIVTRFCNKAPRIIKPSRGNKQDIEDALSPDEIAKLSVKLLDILFVMILAFLDPMDHIHRWRIVDCSAYTEEGLLEGFDWLVQDIASCIYVLD